GRVCEHENCVYYAIVSVWLQEGGPANVGSPLIDEQVDGSTNVGSSNEGRTGG
ncbi:hypothetical protein LINPERHAP1_LOCUS9487, partial [Linum perenne]